MTRISTRKEGHFLTAYTAKTLWFTTAAEQMVTNIHPSPSPSQVLSILNRSIRQSVSELRAQLLRRSLYDLTLKIAEVKTGRTEAILMARELQIIDFCTVTMKVGYKAFFPNSSVTICSNWSNLVKILTLFSNELKLKSHQSH